MNSEKQAVVNFWDKASCGEDLYLKGSDREKFVNQAEIRYKLEPYILEFADFNGSRGRRTLEIGVGLGADHQKFAEAGAELHGCDLTDRAIDHTCKRFALFGLKSSLRQADAENLPYDSDSFDLVYSWGVLHHSPNTPKAISEVHRVLKHGGDAKIMIYHKYSFVGYMLWIRYALLKLKPFTPLSTIYANYLESPGTKAYSISEAKDLFSDFSNVQLTTVLTHGDLLSSAAGQRHTGILLSIARRIWPRRTIKRLFPSHGLFLLIHAIK